MSTDQNRDFQGDKTLENGNYLNSCARCGHGFMGHKRRVICRECESTGGVTVTDTDQYILELSVERDALAERVKELEASQRDYIANVEYIAKQLREEQGRSTRMHRRAQLAESACGSWRALLGIPQYTGRLWTAALRLGLEQQAEKIEALERAGMMLRNCLCFDNQDLNAAMVAWENAAK